jgi:hypothetical protein
MRRLDEIARKSPASSPPEPGYCVCETYDEWSSRKYTKLETSCENMDAGHESETFGSG